MSIKNGMLLSYLQKDYEISSWNEQGEITRIEGILTIAFFISVCSHRDRKQLYLIMKIPYLVNMSSEDRENFPLPRNIKIVDGFPGIEETEQRIKKLEERIKELEEENAELKKKIEELEKKRENIEKLKAENIGLKELLGKSSSGWEIKGDNVAVGLNPFTKKVEQYGFPKNFNEKKANDLHYTDEKFYMCKFKYYYDDQYPWPNNVVFKDYDMPMTLYEYLCNRTQIEIDIKTKKEIKKPSDKGMPNKFQSPESLLQYFREKLDKKYYSYSLIKIIVPFIFENSKKQFGLEDAREYCKTKRGKKPSDATMHKHFNLLIEHDIIYRKYHGVYEVNELSLNFD